MAEKKASVAKAAVYYVVNPYGVVHPVNKDMAKALLKQPGFRMAEKEEIAALGEMGGEQTPKRAAGKKAEAKKVEKEGEEK